MENNLINIKKIRTSLHKKKDISVIIENNDKDILESLLSDIFKYPIWVKEIKKCIDKWVSIKSINENIVLNNIELPIIFILENKLSCFNIKEWVEIPKNLFHTLIKNYIKEVHPSLYIELIKLEPEKYLPLFLSHFETISPIYKPIFVQEILRNYKESFNEIIKPYISKLIPKLLTIKNTKSIIKLLEDKFPNEIKNYFWSEYTNSEWGKVIRPNIDLFLWCENIQFSNIIKFLKYIQTDTKLFMNVIKENPLFLSKLNTFEFQTIIWTLDILWKQLLLMFKNKENVTKFQNFILFSNILWDNTLFEKRRSNGFSSLFNKDTWENPKQFIINNVSVILKEFKQKKIPLYDRIWNLWILTVLYNKIKTSSNNWDKNTEVTINDWKQKIDLWEGVINNIEKFIEWNKKEIKDIVVNNIDNWYFEFIEIPNNILWYVFKENPISCIEYMVLNNKKPEYDVELQKVVVQWVNSLISLWDIGKIVWFDNTVLFPEKFYNQLEPYYTLFQKDISLEEHFWFASIPSSSPIFSNSRIQFFDMMNYYENIEIYKWEDYREEYYNIYKDYYNVNNNYIFPLVVYPQEEYKYIDEKSTYEKKLQEYEDLIKKWKYYEEINIYDKYKKRESLPKDFKQDLRKMRWWTFYACMNEKLWEDIYNWIKKYIVPFTRHYQLIQEERIQDIISLYPQNWKHIFYIFDIKEDTSNLFFKSFYDTYW